MSNEAVQWLLYRARMGVQLGAFATHDGEEERALSTAWVEMGHYGCMPRRTTNHSEWPAGEDPFPPKEETPPKTKAVPAPKEKAGSGGKRSEAGEGGGGRRSRELGPHDPLVGTTAFIPCGGGVELGTLYVAPARQSGVVWLEYDNHPKVYNVERHLIFSTAEAAVAHLNKVCNGKIPPPPPRRSTLMPRINLKKTLHPTKLPPRTQQASASKLGTTAP